MNRFIKVAVLLSIVTMFLTALSFQTAEARTNVSPCQVCQGRFIPSSGGSPFHFLSGDATVSASDIWAVGSSQNQKGNSRTLIEHWDGSTWSIIQSPNPGASSNSLSEVAAISTSDIWAVGFFANSTSSYQTLIEHWNGTTWSVVTSPNPAGWPFNSLNGVVAVSANNVWAVGNSSNNTSSVNLIEHWNGSTWRIITSPSPGAMRNSLSAVTAVSASDIWAVGSFANNTTNTQTLIEHWNGATWGVVASPNPGTNSNFLNGVVAVSANNVWAVGLSYSGSSFPTLIEHWNGTKWSVMTSPNPVGSPGSVLDTVVAVSARDIWAVGNFIERPNPHHPGTGTLIEHWNGSTWSIVTSPNYPHSLNNALSGIAIVSASNIWAVGGYSTTNGIEYTLVEHWNGSKWKIVTSPNMESNHHSFN